MSAQDDKTNRGEPDRSLYDHNDRNERAYMLDKMRKRYPAESDEEIQKAIEFAIKNAGNSESREKIEDRIVTYFAARDLFRPKKA